MWSNLFKENFNSLLFQIYSKLERTTRFFFDQVNIQFFVYFFGTLYFKELIKKMDINCVTMKIQRLLNIKEFIWWSIFLTFIHSSNLWGMLWLKCSVSPELISRFELRQSIINPESWAGKRSRDLTDQTWVMKEPTTAAEMWLYPVLKAGFLIAEDMV